ncbi:MAG TPA: S1 RNA-binding domain-containing protein, partial [Planctomycetota bacterium]|nr:S1 RNA-binding domain-containing protein [Planctomycetota bacterium]
SFGAFVELEKDLEGLLHISKVDKDAESSALGAGDVLEVKVVKLEPNEGKIGLSLVKVLEKGKEVPAPAPAAPSNPPTTSVPVITPPPPPAPTA